MSRMVETKSRSFAARRITLVTAAPFAEVTAQLEAAFPPLAPEAMEALIQRGDGAALQAYLEKTTPAEGFSVFTRMPQGEVMSALGTSLKATLYLIGNALTARSMFALEPATGLGAPVRVVVTEVADGSTHIDYDEPSSVFSQLPTLAESKVPAILDEKFREALTAFAS